MTRGTSPMSGSTSGSYPSEPGRSGIPGAGFPVERHLVAPARPVAPGAVAVLMEGDGVRNAQAIEARIESGQGGADDDADDPPAAAVRRPGGRRSRRRRPEPSRCAVQGEERGDSVGQNRIIAAMTRRGRRGHGDDGCRTRHRGWSSEGVGSGAAREWAGVPWFRRTARLVAAHARPPALGMAFREGPSGARRRGTDLTVARRSSTYSEDGVLMAGPRHHDVLVVGGGNAGISLAAKLRRDGCRDVAVVEPKQVHEYRPLLSYVAVGDGHARRPAPSAGRRDPRRGPLVPRPVVAHRAGALPGAAGERGRADLLRPRRVPRLARGLGRDPGRASRRCAPRRRRRATCRSTRPARGRCCRRWWPGRRCSRSPTGTCPCAPSASSPCSLAADHWRRTGVLDAIDDRAARRGEHGWSTCDRADGELRAAAEVVRRARAHRHERRVGRRVDAVAAAADSRRVPTTCATTRSTSHRRTGRPTGWRRERADLAGERRLPRRRPADPAAPRPPDGLGSRRRGDRRRAALGRGAAQAGAGRRAQHRGPPDRRDDAAVRRVLGRAGHHVAPRAPARRVRPRRPPRADHDRARPGAPAPQPAACSTGTWSRRSTGTGC